MTVHLPHLDLPARLLLLRRRVADPPSPSDVERMERERLFWDETDDRLQGRW